MNVVYEVQRVVKLLTAYVACCAFILNLPGAAVAQPAITGTVPVGQFGHQLYFEMQGQGEPVVLIHGLTLDWRMWDAQFDFLAQKYRVIRYDVIGHGNSSGLDGPLANGSVRRWDDLRDLLDALAVDKAHVVGLSMGAEIAIDFALEHPDRVQTLTSIDGDVAGYAWDNTPGAFANRVAQYYTISFNQGVQAALPLWAADALFAPAMSDPVLRAQLQEIVINGHGALGAGAMFQWPNPTKLAVVSPPVITRLHEIGVPTLVMVGGLDLPDFQQQADILDREIADSTKLVIPGAGHMANMEQPLAVNTILFDFLQTHSVPDLIGDYNQNGIVDAADYTTWRNNVDAPAGTLPNDADGGAIGQAQYATWTANFGAASPGAGSGSAAVSNSAVPEPASAWLVLIAAASICLPPRQR